MIKTELPYLISHRLRGFDNRDATATGIRNALAAGVQAIEIDLRITKDKQFVINHDAWVPGTRQLIYHLTLAELNTLYPALFSFSELLSLLEDSGCKLFLDIKEYGMEEQILALLRKSEMLQDCTFVSWLPESLLKMHKLAPTIPLCFSHYPVASVQVYRIQRSIVSVRRLFGIYFKRKPRIQTAFHYNDYNRTDFEIYNAIDYRGCDHEHFADTPVTGLLAEALTATGGSVCVHIGSCSKELVAAYAKLHVNVLLYGIKTSKNFTNGAALGAWGMLLDDPQLFKL